MPKGIGRILEQTSKFTAGFSRVWQPDAVKSSDSKAGWFYRHLVQSRLLHLAFHLYLSLLDGKVLDFPLAKRKGENRKEYTALKILEHTKHDRSASGA